MNVASGVGVVLLPDSDVFLDMILLDRCVFEVYLRYVGVDDDGYEQTEEHLRDHNLEKHEECNSRDRITARERNAVILLNFFVALIFVTLKRD